VGEEEWTGMSKVEKREDRAGYDKVGRGAEEVGREVVVELTDELVEMSF